jgi:hypothetical protein
LDLERKVLWKSTLQAAKHGLILDKQPRLSAQDFQLPASINCGLTVSVEGVPVKISGLFIGQRKTGSLQFALD